MKKVLIILMIGIFITGCSNHEATNNTNNTYNFISGNEAYKMIRNEDVVIIDVRSKEEFNTGHLENAVNIPHTSIGSEIKSIVNDLNQKIIIYCRSGARAETASNTLVNLGYTNVYTFGGLNSWSYEIVY